LQRPICATNVVQWKKRRSIVGAWQPGQRRSWRERRDERISRWAGSWIASCENGWMERAPTAPARRSRSDCITPPPNASGCCAAAIRTAPKRRGAPFAPGSPAAMLASGLTDTGAILALLDRDDRSHRACAEAFAVVALPLATSAAVLAELFHLVGDNR
jgi:hypothetical protein